VRSEVDLSRTSVSGQFRRGAFSLMSGFWFSIFSPGSLAPVWFRTDQDKALYEDNEWAQYRCDCIPVKWPCYPNSGGGCGISCGRVQSVHTKSLSKENEDE